MSISIIVNCIKNSEGQNPHYLLNLYFSKSQLAHLLTGSLAHWLT